MKKAAPLLITMTGWFGLGVLAGAISPLSPSKTTWSVLIGEVVLLLTMWVILGLVAIYQASVRRGRK